MTTCAHCPTVPDGGACPYCGQIWRGGTGYLNGYDPEAAFTAAVDEAQATIDEIIAEDRPSGNPVEDADAIRRLLEPDSPAEGSDV